MTRFLFAITILFTLSVMGCGGSNEEVYVPAELQEPMSPDSEAAGDDPRDEPAVKPTI